MKNGKYQIVCTTWHVFHWHDLFNALKDHADFYLITNSNKEWRSESYLVGRPIPENATFVPYYEKGKYDFAILDVDQQCTNLELGKAWVFNDLNQEITDIPKIVINHGCPVWPEFHCKMGMTKPEAEVECRRQMQQMLKGLPMIVNSYEAASEREWGWGYPIHHGMNPDDWWDLEKEPRVFTALSYAGFDEYYNRACMNRTSELLKMIYGHTLWWAKMNVDTHTSFDYYREFLGRSLIYLDTSFRTPMNRGRTEAMLSGACVVQVKGAHDLGMFAKDGENMILVDNDPDKIAALLNDLIENRYEECIRIGQAGKKVAREMFSREKYRTAWLSVIDKLLKGEMKQYAK